MFKIESQETAVGGTVYTVRDLEGEKLDGRFYHWELQKVSDATKETAPVEVLETRGPKVQVHYVGWPPKFDEWISKNKRVEYE